MKVDLLKYKSTAVILNAIALSALLAIFALLLSFAGCKEAPPRNAAEPAAVQEPSPEVSDFLATFTDVERAILADDYRFNEQNLGGMLRHGPEEGVREYALQIIAEKRWQPGPAKVVKGSALKWRELDKREAVAADDYFTMFSGNFAGDADEELLLFPRPRLLSLDGNTRALPELEGRQPTGSWDFDGDGYRELLEMDAKGLSTNLLRLDGTVCGSLPAVPIFENLGHGYTSAGVVLLGDYDGDGSEDILMSAPPVHFRKNYELLAFGVQGTVVLQLGSDWHTDCLIACDIDGDGLDEVIMHHYNNDPEVTGLKLAQRNLIGPRVPYPSFFPAASGNLRGDAAEEVICEAGNLYNPSNQMSLQLKGLEGWADTSFIESSHGNLRVFALGEERLLAAAPQRAPGKGDAIGLWDSNSSLIYQEHFGERVLGLRVLHSAAGPQIVVLTESRVLAAKAAQ